MEQDITIKGQGSKTCYILLMTFVTPSNPCETKWEKFDTEEKAKAKLAEVQRVTDTYRKHYIMLIAPLLIASVILKCEEVSNESESASS